MIIDKTDPDIFTYGFDHIDFGCKQGSSRHLCLNVLGGKNGLGIDINPKYVEEYSNSGGNGMITDASCTNLPDNLVDFCVISHMLEHLPSVSVVEKSIQEAIRISKKFVYIVGPFFDEDEYLKTKGYKFYWSDWTWHPTHVTKKELIYAAASSSQDCHLEIFGRIPVLNSLDENILHVLEKPNQQKFDPTIHIEKKSETFKEGLFKEISALIVKDTPSNIEDVRKNLKLSKRLFSKSFKEI